VIPTRTKKRYPSKRTGTPRAWATAGSKLAKRRGRPTATTASAPRSATIESTRACEEVMPKMEPKRTLIPVFPAAPPLRFVE
jgi:predicted RNase H-like nuclease